MLDCYIEVVVLLSLVFISQHVFDNMQLDAHNTNHLFVCVF